MIDTATGIFYIQFPKLSAVGIYQLDYISPLCFQLITINATTKKGFTALHAAQFKSSFFCVQKLFNRTTLTLAKTDMYKTVMYKTDMYKSDKYKTDMYKTSSFNQS